MANDVYEPERREFLESFGSHSLEAQPLAGDDVLREDGKIFRSMICGPNDSPLADECCGWWWCREPESVRLRWTDLTEAFEHLRARAIDPRTAEVAGIGWMIQTCRAKAQGVEDLEKLHRALATLVLKGEADEVRHNFMVEIATKLRWSREWKSDQAAGAPIDKPLRYVLEAFGRSYQYKDIAAILLLLGVDRDSWPSLKEKVRGAYRRMKSDSQGEKNPGRNAAKGSLLNH